MDRGDGCLLNFLKLKNDFPWESLEKRCLTCHPFKNMENLKKQDKLSD